VSKDTNYIFLDTCISKKDTIYYFYSAKDSIKKDSLNIDDVWNLMPTQGKRAFLRIATKLDSVTYALDESIYLNKLLYVEYNNSKRYIQYQNFKIENLQKQIIKNKNTNRIVVIAVGVFSFFAGLLIGV
jgi:hypothetical protein